MGVSVGEQTIAISAAALCALSAGLLYDLLRVLRRGASRVGSLVCDTLFCLYCTFSLFAVGMIFARGHALFWEAAAFLTVFGLYQLGVSPSISPAFGTLLGKIAKNLKKDRQKVK